MSVSLALVFPSEDALSAALLAGLVPRDVQGAAALVGRREDGALELVPQAPLGASQAKALALAGVQSEPPRGNLRAVPCWAAALAPRPAPLPDGALPLVLFALDAPEGLLALASELLRLGCDRQELALAGGSALVRARAPSFFVVDGARDGRRGVRAFVPSPAGQDRVWTELGWAHPLAERVEPPAEGVLLIHADGTFVLRQGHAWHPLDTLLAPAGVEPAEPLAPGAVLPRIPVALRLERLGKGEPPSLWLLREKGREVVEALVRALPQAQLDALLFAAVDDLMVLRARPGREAQVPDVPGDGFARVAALPNLFVPHLHGLAPPLQRELLRTWLTPDPDLVVWLEPGPHGLRRQQLAEHAFRPLSDFVEYVVDTSADTLGAWVQSARFAFEDVVVSRATEDRPPAAAGARRAPAPAAAQAADPGAPPPLPPRKPAPAPLQRTTPAGPLAFDAPAPLGEAERRVAQVEAAFLALDAGAGSAEQRAAWLELARAYTAASRAADAGLAWAHVVWEEPPGPAQGPLAREWAQAAGSHVEALLALESPTPEQTRALAAHLWASCVEGAAAPAAPGRLVGFLDRHEEDLDVRSLWLARLALSRLSGGDALMLARARDRVLQRLQRGMSLARDTPRLLRTTGPGSGHASERTARVAQQLEALLTAFDETQRKRAFVEAPTALTRAYVRFEFAWAFARLGQAERAVVLRAESSRALPAADPVHQYFVVAYQARIAQALESAPPEAPLPREVQAALAQVTVPQHKFVVDRLRQASTVLEPQERVDPYRAFLRRRPGQPGDESLAHRAGGDPRELVRLLEERARDVGDERLGGEERARVLDTLLDALPALPASTALPLLQRFAALAERLPAPVRLAPLEDALQVAGHFGQEGLVRQLVTSLGALLRELPSDSATEAGPALAAGVRSLARLGLREQARDLLTRAAGVLKGKDHRSLAARLALAGGFAYLADAAAEPIFDEALTRLSREKEVTVPADRSRLTRAAARALGHAPADVALPGLLRLASQLPFLTDTYNTNSHFCLTLVDFADALVLGHVGEALVLHPATRRFLEEDEDRVRRRVHREAHAGVA